MAKKDPKPFIERAILDYWACQRNIIDEESEEYKLLDAQVGALQDVYRYITGDDFTGEDAPEDSDVEERSVDPEDEEDDDSKESGPEVDAIHEEEDEEEEK